MMNKYIFLDYDGVIKPFSKTNGSVVDESICIQYLEDILDQYPEALIVLTTDNRYSFSFEELKTWFPLHVADRIVGQTTTELYVPSAKEHYEQYIETRDITIRDQEIALYINENDIDPADCVALDDIWEITCIPLVKTKSEEGLTEELAVEVMEYFEGIRQHYNLDEEVVQQLEF
jgi:hypothetical protein